MDLTTRRAFLRRAAGVGAGLAFVSAARPGTLTGTPPVSWAQPASEETSVEPAFGTWEPLPFPPGLSVGRIFTPLSGALLVSATGEGSPLAPQLWRSDDGGTTWREIAVPPMPEVPEFTSRYLTVDPTDHTVLFAVVKDVLYRSTDEGASWQPLAPEQFAQAGRASLPIVSLADPAMLFVIASLRAPFRVLWSRDRGDTWETFLDGNPPTLKSGDWGTSFLLPDPTDPARLYHGIGYGGETPPADEVRVSDDQGRSWRPVSGPTQIEWVGGSGANARVYWGVSAAMGPSDPSLRGLSASASRKWTSRIVRSADRGETWTVMFDLVERLAKEGPTRPALVADSSRADRLFGVLTATGERSIKVSDDGGATWRPAGHDGPVRVSAFAVGIDGRNLFASGAGGLWRLPLT